MKKYKTAVFFDPGWCKILFKLLSQGLGDNKYKPLPQTVGKNIT